VQRGGRRFVLCRLVLVGPVADEIGRRLRGRRRSVEDEPPDAIGTGRSGMLSGWRGEERDQRKACGKSSSVLSLSLCLFDRVRDSLLRLLTCMNTPRSVRVVPVDGICGR
jgi:hypothetical protein